MMLIWVKAQLARDFCHCHMGFALTQWHNDHKAVCAFIMVICIEART